MHASKKKSQGKLENNSNENENIYQYLRNSAKVVLQGKYVALNACTRNEKDLLPS